ncbi:YlaF family protein [Rossellomorea sp. NS-SX7]|uniref:YlaF family protein n=1 Tax=Rossellomorea sp. NS-SX7 TaxID=3463856 RepID=UPI0040580576
MGNIKWIFVLYSLLAAVSLMGIAISISLASPLLAAGSLVALTIIMGFGFTTKKRYREEGRL